MFSFLFYCFLFCFIVLFLCFIVLFLCCCFSSCFFVSSKIMGSAIQKMTAAFLSKQEVCHLFVVVVVVVVVLVLLVEC